jgi:hypothetical protein
MSSIVRVYNIFTQIQSNFDDNKSILGQDLLKNVFNIESDDDLYYLKPYIFQEIENCETEMLSNNFTSEQISNTIPNFKKYLNDNIFNVVNVSIPDCSKIPLTQNIPNRNPPTIIENADAKRYLISQSNIDRILYEDVYKKQFPKESLTNFGFAARPFQKNFENGYNEQIAQIKTDVQSLREALQKLNKQNDYVYDFILINLDRIDILLNNFEKIRPIYTQFNLYAIIFPVYTISEYSEYREAVESLFYKTVNFINNYGGCGMVVYEIYDKILLLLQKIQG